MKLFSSSIMKAVTVLLLLFFDLITAQQITNAFKLCCQHGEKFANDNSHCDKIKAPKHIVKPEELTMCFSSMSICCSKVLREKQCQIGLSIARDGNDCSSNTLNGIHFNKDCCEACKIGLIAGSMGNDCDPYELGLNSPADKAYLECCQHAVTETPIPTTSPKNYSNVANNPPIIDDFCEMFPGQLCEHICVSEPGSYHCECRPGYVLLADRNSCKASALSLTTYNTSTRPISNNNRCADNNPCEQHCTDTGVAVKCSCDRGFQLARDQTSCNDIDECALGLSNCDPYTEICTNTDGSFTCQLQAPYTSTNNLSNKGLISENNCPSGYIFNSNTQNCDDIDECSQELDDCNRESQDCLNTYGNFTCQNKVSKKTCPPGFKRNTLKETCEDIDECENNPCAINEICNNVSGGYQCEPSATSISLNQPFIYPLLTSKNPLLVNATPWTIPYFKADPTNVRDNSISSEPTYRVYTSPPLKSTTERQYKRSEDRLKLEPVTMYTSRQINPNNAKNNSSSCAPGYRVNYFGVCDDINECYEEIHDCDSNQDCVNTKGSFNCRCKNGFQLNSFTNACEDINECQQVTAQCGAFQRCDNTYGSYRCTRVQGCGTGYTLNDASDTCEDNDECALGTHNCHMLGSNYECRNTVGSFRCVRKSNRKPYSYKPKISTSTTTTLSSTQIRDYPINISSPIPSTSTNEPLVPSLKHCFPGYRLNSWGQCEDIDECSEGKRCKANERCINTEGDYRCEAPQCSFGKQLNPEGTRCVDIDECELNIHKCGPNKKCINKDGGYLCQCPPGHMLKGDNCEDVDECEKFRRQICASNSICENTVGSFRCICKNGFRSVNDTSCEDIDECRDIPNLCEHSCVNNWGSYRCACKQGFILNKDNRTCSDIDECKKFNNIHLCVGLCVNTPGSYKCACPPGYKLNGRICVDINECESSSACQPQELCLNMRGSYKCQEVICPPGYKKNIDLQNRCTLDRSDPSALCQGPRCTLLADTISYNYIIIPSLLPIPEKGFNEIFLMRGPKWTGFRVEFDMKLQTVTPGNNLVRVADLSYFQMRKSTNFTAVIEMIKSIEGPQDIEISIQMTMYYHGNISSIAVAKLYMFVSQYTF